MSVLIKGYKMPKTCMNGGCPIDGRYCDLWWKAGGGSYGRHRKCPLVEIPPHGRLIDADALQKEINERVDAAIKWGVNAIADGNDEIKMRAEQAVATFCEISLTASKLPTVVEAEKAEE